MTRRLLNLLTALSLLLCVALSALWVQSHVSYQHVSRGTSDHGAFVVRSLGGRMYLERRSFWTNSPSLYWYRLPPGRTTINVHERRYSQSPSRAELLGFGVYRGTEWVWADHFQGAPNSLPPKSHPAGGATTDYRTLAVPYWSLVAATAAMPYVRWRPVDRVLRILRRRVPGTCAACGYDLRATPGRCPECGTTAEGTPT
jgi:hypothetical protein